VLKIVPKSGQFFLLVAVAAALLVLCNLALAAEKKAAPAAVSEAKHSEQKATADSVEEYAACSPEYSDKQIQDITKFISELSPGLVPKMREILLRCDFKVNNDLLGTLTSVQEELAGMDFSNAEQAKEFRQEKSKEIEIQIALAQTPVNQGELKKLVGELFDFRQRSMKHELADLEKQAEMLKKRIEERQKLKEQITDRKIKEIATGAHSSPEGKEPAHDPLSWD
jgi:hypothetical protein